MTAKMVYSNLRLAKLLRSVAAALSYNPANKFRIIAYERAADAVEHSSTEIKDLWDNRQLDTLAGIGPNIASHLDELFRTGRSRHFDEVLKPYPPALFELLEIPGIGPKTALKLTSALQLNKAHTAVSQLEKAAKKGQICKIEGLGEQTQNQILQSINTYRTRIRRLLLPQASAIAQDIINWLKKSSAVYEANPLGSLRRGAATVGDIDIAVSSNDPATVISWFIKYPNKSRVLDAGEHKASLILPNEYQVDLMVQPPASYGSLLQHFTGSKHHNIALREVALRQGYSLSEYGIKIGKGLKEFATEKDFYNYLGFDWIPPELREDRTELTAAAQHQLPTLVELADLKGDLQVHSDIDIEPSHDLGQSSLSQLVAAAAKLGHEYLGLTDHNPSVSGHTPTQITKLIRKRKSLIEQFNDSYFHPQSKRVVYLFNGLEIDIQPDGKLPVSDSDLDLLDYACVSIHSSFNQSRAQATKRVLLALNHPKVRFFAHPTARLLGEREGVDLEWDQIFDFCLTHKKWLEIDAWPNRLDLPDSLVYEAVKKGVKIVIDTDSHHADQLKYLTYGVTVARRGWATASDIINTLTLEKIKKLFKGGEI